MGKVIFRKIGGRLVPIRIGSVADAIHRPGAVGRKITAHVIEKTGEKTQVAHLNLTIPKKGISSTVNMVNVERKFQGVGLAKELFLHAQKLMGRAGKKFMRSTAILDETMVKHRFNLGKTKYIGSGFDNGHDPVPRLMNASKAYDAVKSARTQALCLPKSIPFTVQASTMIPKALRRKK